MPATVNGFGTSVCGGRGDIGWGSFDGMEWFVAAFMPIIPYKAVHTFDWQGEQYRAMPIRWSFELMIRTFLTRWVWGLILGGLLFGIIGFVAKGGFILGMIVAGVVMLGLGIGIAIVLPITDQRNRDIRRVLGPVTIGNCDPAHLPAQTLDEMIKPSQLAYGTKTFGEAVEKLLDEGRFAQAMWAARVCTATENAGEGEALTNLVLNHPAVKDAIERVRKNAQEWGNVMLNDSERQPPPQEPADALPADDDDRARRGRSDDDRTKRRSDEDY